MSIESRTRRRRRGDPHACGPRLFLHFADLAGALRRVLAMSKPDEIYTLGAQSHVRVSFDQPEYTGDIDALGVVRLLEAVRELRPRARCNQASSSPRNLPLPPTQPLCPLLLGLLGRHTSPRRRDSTPCRIPPGPPVPPILTQ